MSDFILGGWSQSLSAAPLSDFDVMMYGMVTNLSGLTTGTATQPGWSPEKAEKPNNNPDFKGKTLWVYGGGGCSPQGMPSGQDEVDRIIHATENQHWDGVDFDDECNMNIDLVTDAMRKLNNMKKENSFGFIAGYSYNHPKTPNGEKINNKLKKLITSGECNRYILYCYATAMWSQNDIINNVTPAINRTLQHGAKNKQCILALTSRGLTDWNLNYFIDQVLDFNLGGLFIWRYDKLTSEHYKIIQDRLKG